MSVEERKVINEYQECYSNPQMLKEAKQWEKAGIESWLNYEKNKINWTPGLFLKK